MFFVFLLSGLFLGWSLGANDAANVYGTAVGTRMIRFRTAAVICSLFVLVGAVFGGAGASHTLGKLGAVNALPGAFTVALAAALTVTWMTRLKLPVSTSQAIVGAIIGWNFFSGALTGTTTLTKIVSSWVLCPVLAAVFAFVLLRLTQLIFRVVKLHLFTLDVLTRYGLIVIGAFAAYSLGANNIANVMGVFVPSAPFPRLHLALGLSFDPAQQLFFLGAIAIGAGVITYSKKVMMTVGSDLFRLSPITALVVVLAQALVLFLFSSVALENWLVSKGLPAIPLVPVSSSQAVIGAIIGIGLAKGGRNIHWSVLGRIASGWVSTPVASGILCFVVLFFVQNVFSQQVFVAVPHQLSSSVVVKLKQEKLFQPELAAIENKTFEDARSMKSALENQSVDAGKQEKIIDYCRSKKLVVDAAKLSSETWLSKEQQDAVGTLNGQRYEYGWQLDDALAAASPQWRLLPGHRSNKLHNKELRSKLDHLASLFAVLQ